MKYIHVDAIYVMDGLWNGASSVPKFVLRYLLDKDSTSFWHSKLLL